MILLDTHLVLWAAAAHPRLPAVVAEEVLRDGSEVCFSAVSIWEIAVKASLGRTDFNVDPREMRRALLAQGWTELAVSGAHAAAVVDLPALHRDPFDRLLVAQARIENVPLWTADRALESYGAPVRLV